MTEYPEPTVGAYIFNEKGEVFFMKSPKWNDKYICPGGHIELGETFEEALKREVKEETNLEIYDIKPIAFHNCIFSKEFHKKKHFIFFDLICKAKPGKIILNSEGSGYVWMEPKKAFEELDLEYYAKLSLKRILDMKNEN